MYIVFESFGKISWTKASLCYKSIHVIHFPFKKTTLERSVDLSDLYVDLSDLYVDLSDLYVDLSLIHLLENES